MTPLEQQRRYELLKNTLVPEARDSWQQHKDQECREVLYGRYMLLYGEMDNLEFQLYGRKVTLDENQAPKRCSTRSVSAPEKLGDVSGSSDTHSHGGRLSLDRKSSLHRHHDTSKTVDLISMIRNDASGVWNE